MTFRTKEDDISSFHCHIMLFMTISTTFLLTKKEIYIICQQYYMFHCIYCFAYSHAAMIQTTVEILQTLQLYYINLRFIAEHIIKYLCGMQKQSIPYSTVENLQLNRFSIIIPSTDSGEAPTEFDG